jgi:hypothetical protein
MSESLIDFHLDVGRQTFDLDLAPDELEDTALLLDALRLALHEHRNRDANGTVHPDAIEVRVQNRVRDRIELKFLDQHAGIGRAAELQRDQGVGPRFGVENLEERPGIDGNRRGVAIPALGAGAVHHGRHPPLAPRPPRFIFSERVSRFCFEYGFHI